jgi:gamma-glutamylcyclotransferase (GGCT)/AIG2-like uncharacterized protein YtfP
MTERETTIRFFFYGTLMRGECRHDLVAPWLVHAESARVWGRLYQLEAGYPALEVPGESILAEGTEDVLLDTATAHWRTTHPLKMHGGDWGWVHGQVAELREPTESVPPMDEYEEVRSGEACLYRRVLIPAALERDTQPAWTYIRHTGDGGMRIPSGLWTP